MEFLSISKSNFSKDNVIQKSIAILPCDNFHVDFTNLIGSAEAIWKSTKPAPYFDSTKTDFFFRKKGTEMHESHCYGNHFVGF